MLAACNKNDIHSAGGTVRVSAKATAEETKMEFGSLADGKRALSWSNEGEEVQLWEFLDANYIQAATSSSFTVDATDPKQADFTAELAATEGEGSFDYVAIYPASSGRTGQRTNVPSPSCISYALSVTASDAQVPTATTPDNNWMVLTAVHSGKAAQGGDLDLQFEHQTAYGKMTFKNFPLADGESLSKVTLEGPAGKYFVGRRWYDYKTGETLPYSENAQKSVFVIDPKNIEANSTAFDIWFSILPVELVQNEVLKITVVTSLNTRIAEINLSKDLNFRKGEVSSFTVNWDNYKPAGNQKILTFDFTTQPKGWPNKTQASTNGTPIPYTYTLNGTDYTFLFAAATDATALKVYWNTNGYMGVMASHRYWGMPAIEGYKLVQASYVHATTTKARAAGIVDKVYSSKETKVFVKGGETTETGWSTLGETITYNLEETVANTVYYLVCTKTGIGISSATLTYEAVE